MEFAEELATHEGRDIVVGAEGFDVSGVDPMRLRQIYFPCSADHEQDWQRYRVDTYSATVYVMTIRTYSTKVSFSMKSFCSCSQCSRLKSVLTFFSLDAFRFSLASEMSVQCRIMPFSNRSKTASETFCTTCPRLYIPTMDVRKERLKKWSMVIMKRQRHILELP